jgi:hypothetical protein
VKFLQNSNEIMLFQISLKDAQMLGLKLRPLKNIGSMEEFCSSLGIFLYALLKQKIGNLRIQQY